MFGSKAEFDAAIRALEAARDLTREVILDALRAALKSAYDKMPDHRATNVTVEFDPATMAPRVMAHFAVTEAKYIEDPLAEMTPEQAQAYKPGAVVGDAVTFDVTPEDFGRIAAQTAKQVMLQRFREAEREQTYMTYADREGEIVYGTIQTANRDLVTVALDRVEAVLPKSGQIPGERYTPNQRIRVYVAEVKRSPKGPQIIVSRTHKTMLRRLMELEIPEVFQGVVEIRAIAREAGSRSKVAVWTAAEGVDPVGACVGMRGVRIQSLVRELGGEKIDIIQWDPDPRVFIKHALSPARVMYVYLEDPEEDVPGARGTASVVVPDDQLSLAIGREGQNARLGAKLTGWRIDIRAESEARDLIDTLREQESAARAERIRDAAEAVEAAAAAAAAARAADQAAAPSPAAPVVDDEAPELEPPTIAEPSAPPVVPDLPATAPEIERPAARSAPAPLPAPTEFDDELESGEPEHDHRGRRTGRYLERDPKTGRLVAKHTHKRSRGKNAWEEEIDRWIGEGDFEDALGFTADDFLGDEDDEDA